MKRLLLFVILFSVIMGLSGCFLDPAESLYAMPKQSRDFYDLQAAVEEFLPSDGAYAPPMVGDNQQAVQLSDLDGDGENEALVYIRGAGDAPMSLCIFHKQGESYQLLAKLDGAGSAFDRVYYAQLDGKGGNEIIVGRRLSEQVTCSLSVYTLQDGAVKELLTAGYSEFVTGDLNSDGLTDLVLLRNDADAKNGIAEFYHWQEDQLYREVEARMSAPAYAVKRIITGKMSRGIPAVFVGSEYGENTIVTDVFGIYNGEFTNLALAEDADTAVQTVREYYVYSSDIDDDGLIELPRILPLQSVPEDSTSENQSLISWYNLAPGGGEERKDLTYHNYSGGWYLSIPEAWAENLIVTRSSAFDSTMVFNFSLLTAAGDLKPLFSLAALSGEGAQKAQQEQGWIKINAKGEISYFCLIEDIMLPLEDVTDSFHFIRIDWNTGETGE